MDLRNMIPSRFFEDRTGEKGMDVVVELLMKAGVAKPAQRVQTQSPIKKESKPYIKAVDWNALADYMLNPQGLNPDEQRAIEDWNKSHRGR